ncbi:hypothetical protein FRC18_006139 [Serendipita sp. 400]|nr:hypothetical protein FRC18_006139 [Serendipita sp. 400]
MKTDHFVLVDRKRLVLLVCHDLPVPSAALSIHRGIPDPSVPRLPFSPRTAGLIHFRKLDLNPQVKLARACTKVTRRIKQGCLTSVALRPWQIPIPSSSFLNPYPLHTLQGC